MPPGRPLSDIAGLSSGSCGDARPSLPSLPTWALALPVGLQSNPSLQAIAYQSAGMAMLEFDLPCPTPLAGKVLQHCVAVIERLFRKWEPLIFKIGWTHNACWRWSNSLYGYAHSREKWSTMTVLYLTDEPYGPAMLEAALIERYGCDWSAVLYLFKHGLFLFWCKPTNKSSPI